jgi:hypothetical protein
LAGGRLLITPHTSLRVVGNVAKFTSYYPGFTPVELSSHERSAQRAKRIITDKINGFFPFCYAENPTLHKKGWRVRFLTLTEDRGFPDHAIIAKHFKSFKKRLSALMNAQFAAESASKLAYVAVRERGSVNGRLHLHLIIFSPFIRAEEWRKLWPFGAIYIEKIKELNNEMMDIPNLYAYMTKYFSKNFDKADNKLARSEDDIDRTDWASTDANKKRFFSSRNIKRRVFRLARVNLSSIREIKEFCALIGLGCPFEIKYNEIKAGSLIYSIPIRYDRDYIISCFKDLAVNENRRCSNKELADLKKIGGR